MTAATAAVALIQSEFAFEEAALHNILTDYHDDLTEAEFGQILRHLSDHIVALETVAATLRKETVV